MEVRREIITPEKAQEYLTFNTKNFRPLNSRVVARYAEDMAKGFWQDNGEPIQFAEDGTLLNGQHRLHAIIRSGCPIEMIVVTGVSKNVDIYDFTCTRTPASIAKYYGIANSNNVMAVASLMVGRGFNNTNPSKGELLHYGKIHEAEIGEAYRLAITGGGDKVCKKAACVTMIYCLLRLNKIDPDTVMRFCKIANSGNVEGNEDRSPSPALMFRKQTMKMGRVGGRAAQRYVAEVFYSALMDFDGKKMRYKSYKDDSEYPTKLINKVINMDEEGLLSEVNLAI